MKKRGAITLSVNAIVIIILALAMLAVGIGLFRMMMSSSADKAQEMFDAEPDPPEPGAYNPVTVSREVVRTEPGATEAIKVSVYNPTSHVWNNRGSLYHGATNICGLYGDGVCYRKGICTDFDPDCYGGMVCNTATPTDGKCYWDDSCEGLGNLDLDCETPTNADGVPVMFFCNNELALSTFSYRKIINPNSIQTYTLLIDIAKVPPGSYICRAKVMGQDDASPIPNKIKGYKKDITIEVN